MPAKFVFYPVGLCSFWRLRFKYLFSMSEYFYVFVRLKRQEKEGVCNANNRILPLPKEA